jgi:hypothetical protein
MLMKIRVFSFFALLLVGCSSSVEKNQQKIEQCSVLGHIRNFDIIPFFSPYDDVNREQVFGVIVDSFKNIGEVQVSAEQSLFDSLLQSAPVSQMSAVLSIGKLGNDMRGSLKIGTEVQVIANECNVFSVVWSKECSIRISDDKNQLTDEASQLVKELVEAFALDYSEANANGGKPIFDIRNVIRSF